MLRGVLEQRSAEWKAQLRDNNPKVARELVRRLIGRMTHWEASLPAQRPAFVPMGDARTVPWSAKARAGELFDGTDRQQVASPPPASWNQIMEWLRKVDDLRRAA